MMKKNIICLFAVLMPILAWAGNVSEQQALLKARQFMKGKTFSLGRNRRMVLRQDSTKAALYVFNADEGGYAIVSGDDRTTPILGYSLDGRLDMDDMPDNLRAWMEDYSKSIESFDDGNNTMQTLPRRQRAAIDCLIQTRWNQTEPYNAQCPASDNGQRCVTGCVPTAVAQVMCYHQWPQGPTKTIPAYSVEPFGKLPSLPPTTFKWDKMEQSYAADATGESADAVAELMRYVGQAFETYYSLGSSSAVVDTEKLINYFGYSTNTRRADRNQYSSAEWEDLIYQELYEGRPVLYSGCAANEGHQFICDGYDGNGFFHINWGWGGKSNGYYLLSLCSPTNSKYPEGFSRSQDAILGMKPQEEGDTYSYIYAETFSHLFKSAQYDRAASGDFEKVYLFTYYYSQKGNRLLDLAWGLYDDDRLLKVMDVQSNVSLVEGKGQKMESTVSFGAGLGKGRYLLLPLYRELGTEVWKKAYTPFRYFILADVDANSMTTSLASSFDKNVEIKNVTMAVKKQNRKTALTLSYENQGFSHEQVFYAWLEGDDSYSCRASGYTEHGKTGEVTLYVTPVKSGNVKLTITSDYDKKNILYVETITISEPSLQTISFETEVNGVKENRVGIEGTTAQVKMDLNNIGTNGYDDYIGVELDKEFINTSGYTSTTLVSNNEYPVSIVAGKTGSLNVVFDNLDSRTNYRVYTYYYSNDGIVRNNGYVLIRTDMPYTGLYRKEGTKFSFKTEEGIDMVFTVANGDEREANVTYHCIDQNYEGKITVPVIADGYRVVNITSYAFDGCTKLSSVYIPDGVALGGKGVFFGCSSLKDVRLPDDLASLPTSIFYGCTGLEKITLPALLTAIDERAFNGGVNVTVTSLVKEPFPINANVFTSQTYSNTLYVPAGTESKYRAADGWNNFKTIEELEPSYDDDIITFADEEVKRICIENWDTNNDGELSKAEAAVVTDIGKAFFNNNTMKSFDELQYFTGLETIADNAFGYCGNLTSVVFPSSVTSVGAYAFYRCASLSSVDLHDAISVIGKCAFYDCKGITAVTLLGSVTSINNYAFSGCSLSSINIPSSVTFIGGCAFSGCADLSSIAVEDGNTVYHSPNNCNAVIERNTNKLIVGCKNTIIPDFVESIGTQAFEDCTGLTSISIPNSVTSINQKAFYGCTGLNEVHSLIEEPFVINENVFQYADDGDKFTSATLYVPKHTKAKYLATDGWKNFGDKIVEMEGSESLRGDLNGDGKVDIGDMVELMNIIIKQ